MGFIGSLVGGTSGNSGGSGMNYQAGSAGLMMPVTADQLSQSNSSVNSGLDQQQALINALSQQQGLANQTQVYGQEQGLQSQLQGIAAGTGPNPAQAMLNQATGQNVQQQAALMAGQRGASQNVGMIARQAGQQGMQAQQQAAGQGATMQAQQSLAAISAQQQQQQMLASMANQQAGQQIGAIGAYNQFAQGQQGNLLGAAGQYNNALVGNMSSQNTANAGVAGVTAKNQSSLIGGGMSGIGAAVGLAKGGEVPQNYAFGSPSTVQPSSGPSFYDFYGAKNPNASTLAPKPTGALQAFGQQFSSNEGGGQDPIVQGMTNLGKGIHTAIHNANANSAVNDATPMQTDNMGMVNDPSFSTGSPVDASASDLGSAGDMSDVVDAGGSFMAAKGGKVPVMLSPGEKTLNPREAKAVAEGKADPMRTGKKVPGQAKVKGDSLKNDTFPTTLDSGGVVIPRSVMNSKNPSKEAAKFVQAVMAKSRMKK